MAGVWTGKRNTSFSIDSEKTSRIIKDYCEKNGKNLSSLNAGIGFTSSAITTAIRAGRISWVMMRKLNEVYGFTKQQFELDPEPVPEPDTPEVKEPVQPVHLDTTASDAQISKLFEKLDELTDSMNAISKALTSLIAITPSAVDVQIAVRDGIREVRSMIGKDMLKDLRGCTFSAVLEAMKKANETMVWEAGNGR